jgi:hypothetical protein
MVVEVFAGIGAFKTMLELAKGMKDIDPAPLLSSFMSRICSGYGPVGTGL